MHGSHTRSPLGTHKNVTSVSPAMPTQFQPLGHSSMHVVEHTGPNAEVTHQPDEQSLFSSHAAPNSPGSGGTSGTSNTSAVSSLFVSNEMSIASRSATWVSVTSPLVASLEVSSTLVSTVGLLELPSPHESAVRQQRRTATRGACM